MTDSTAHPDGLDTLLQRANRLHSAPQVAQSLLNLTRDTDFDIQDVVDCIERDPALAARVLQIQ